MAHHTRGSARLADTRGAYVTIERPCTATNHAIADAQGVQIEPGTPSSSQRREAWQAQPAWRVSPAQARSAASRCLPFRRDHESRTRVDLIDARRTTTACRGRCTARLSYGVALLDNSLLSHSPGVARRSRWEFMRRSHRSPSSRHRLAGQPIGLFNGDASNRYPTIRLTARRRLARSHSPPGKLNAIDATSTNIPAACAALRRDPTRASHHHGAGRAFSAQ